jgi:hypothetical protein
VTPMREFADQRRARLATTCPRARHLRGRPKKRPGAPSTEKHRLRCLGCFWEADEPPREAPSRGLRTVGYHLALVRRVAERRPDVQFVTYDRHLYRHWLGSRPDTAANAERLGSLAREWMEKG